MKTDITHGPDFSILVPLFNEEETLIGGIRKLLVFLEDNGLDAEILLGSNGSTDATPLIGKLLEDAQPGRIRFFHIDQRGHVGRVFRIAAEMAATPLLISMDVDMSIDPIFIATALGLLEKNHIVIGSKLAGFQVRSLARSAGSEFYILCAQALLGLPYEDYSIGAKAYRLDAVKPLLEGISDDTNYVLDILCAAGRGGLKVATAPVDCRDLRSSRFRLLREVLVRFLHLLRVFFREHGNGCPTPKAGNGCRHGFRATLLSKKASL